MYLSSRDVFAAVAISGDYVDKTEQFGPMLAKQLVLDFAVVLLVALLIANVADASSLRVGALCSLLALAYQGMVDVSNAIWWNRNFPLSWALGNMLDQVIGFFSSALRSARCATVTARRELRPPSDQCRCAHRGMQ